MHAEDTEVRWCECEGGVGGVSGEDGVGGVSGEDGVGMINSDSPRPEYCELPVQAVRCELASIKPAGKSSVSLPSCVLLVISSYYTTRLWCMGGGSSPRTGSADAVCNMEGSDGEKAWLERGHTHRTSGGYHY